MGFNRRRRKAHENQDSMWTSYSDLFLGLSVVFLLLYVSASLRQGTDGLKQFIENKSLQKENQDLKQQLKVYDSLKQAYINQDASQDEQKVYENLMAKLDLLKDEANEEKSKLEQQAREHFQKEKALNEYQQVVRNIINANLIAKARIKKRDLVITDKETAIDEQSKQIFTLEKNISRSERKVADLEDNLQDQLEKLEVAFNDNKVSKAKFEREQKRLRQEADSKISDLKAKTDKLYADLAAKQKEQDKLAGQFQSAKSDLQRTKGELAKAQENLNARKKLAKSIKDKFSSNGVKAEVDEGTGDVLLSFEGEYFDTGKARLKPGMKNVLEKAMPAYAQSLFQDPKISEKIENVEIVGFASPTFNGKYIDPSKLSAKDRAAVNFNLDLSYNRAKSIFDHMFTNMDFNHKQRLLPLVKVTGRSFLKDADKRDLAAEGNKSICDQIDCAKKQTVIIKFKLRD